MPDPLNQIQALMKMRLLPEELAALGNQSLLNMVASDEGGAEVWVTIDGQRIDYGAILLEKADSINMDFDSLMVKLGYPEGTGKLIT